MLKQIKNNITNKTNYNRKIFRKIIDFGQIRPGGKFTMEYWVGKLVLVVFLDGQKNEKKINTVPKNK
jgi:hypothetical protein